MDDREPTTIRELSEEEKDANTAGDHCERCGEYEDECTCLSPEEAAAEAERRSDRQADIDMELYSI